jgi:hypothetical protein
MDKTLNAALSQPDIEDVLLSAVDHADVRIRKFVWRGFKPRSAKADHELMVEDKTAEDFVKEAVRRLCDGTRTFNPQKSLLENLNSVTDSLIWSEKKSSDRTGVVDFAQQPGEQEELVNPLLTKPSPVKAADIGFVDKEINECQSKCFKMIKASFDGDQDIQEYLEALSLGYFDIDEISTVTGITVEKIYEIRRKLKKSVPQLFGVTNYEQLERKISEGQ